MTKTTSKENKSLIDNVKDLIAEGNRRELVIKDKKDKVIVNISLTLAVILTLLFPALAAIVAVVSMLGECHVSVKKPTI